MELELFDFRVEFAVADQNVDGLGFDLALDGFLELGLLLLQLLLPGRLDE